MIRTIINKLIEYKYVTLVALAAIVVLVSLL